MDIVQLPDIGMSLERVLEWIRSQGFRPANVNEVSKEDQKNWGILKTDIFCVGKLPPSLVVVSGFSGDDEEEDAIVKIMKGGSPSKGYKYTRLPPSSTIFEKGVKVMVIAV